MMLYLSFVIWALGVTYIVTESAIFIFVRRSLVALFAYLPEPLRVILVRGMYCPACVGFWVGIWCNQLWPGVRAPFGVAEAGLASMLLGVVASRYLFSGVAFQVEMEDTQ